MEATIESQWRLDPGAGEVAAPSAGEVAQPGVAEVAQPGVAEVAVTPVVKTEPVPEPKANSAVEEALNRATTYHGHDEQAASGCACGSAVAWMGEVQGGSP